MPTSIRMKIPFIEKFSEVPEGLKNTIGRLSAYFFHHHTITVFWGENYTFQMFFGVWGVQKGVVTGDTLSCTIGTE